MKATTVSLGARLTEDQRHYLQYKLRVLRDELLERLRRLDESTRRGLSADSGERAQELEDVEVRRELVAEGEKELEAVLAALDRIKGSKFDVCVECAGPIRWQRLEAKPHATRCVTCRQKREHD